MVYRRDRPVWAAVLFRTTRPEILREPLSDVLSDFIGLAMLP